MKKLDALSAEFKTYLRTILDQVDDQDTCTKEYQYARQETQQQPGAEPVEAKFGWSALINVHCSYLL